MFLKFDLGTELGPSFSKKSVATIVNNLIDSNFIDLKRVLHHLHCKKQTKKIFQVGFIRPKY